MPYRGKSVKDGILLICVAAGALILLAGLLTSPAKEAWAEIYFTGFHIDLDQAPQTGDSVTFLAHASNSDGEEVDYNFDLIPDYGTDAYDPFNSYTTIQPFSTGNACTHTFHQDGGYVSVVKASNTTSALSGADPIIGGSIAVGETSGLAITGFSRHPTGTVEVGDSVTFTATAANFDGGTVYYQFDLIPHYGTDDYDPFNNYTTIQAFSAGSSCTHTFDEAGAYILVVKASATAGAPSDAGPIVGGSIVVHPRPQTEYQIGHTSRAFSGSPGSSGDLPVEIYYPAESAGADAQISNGDFPVIVFAHGYQQSYLDYAYLWKEMVPAGYIVAFLNRLSSSATIDIDEYALDIAFCLGKIQEMGANPDSAFYGHVDNKSALMGHSTGGGAIFIAASHLQDDAAYGTATIIGLAPLGRVYGPISGQDPIDAASGVTIPSLIIDGAEDCITPRESHAQIIYDNLSSEINKYSITITEGDHCGFADATGPGRSICELAEFGSCMGLQGSTMSTEDQNRLTVKFVRKWMDHFVKSDETAWYDFKNRLGEDRVTYQAGS